MSSVPESIPSLKSRRDPAGFLCNSLNLSIRPRVSNRQQMAGALRRGPSALVVNLRRRNVPVAEEVLNLHNIHIGVQEQGGGGGAEGVGGIDAAADGSASGELLFLH